MKAKSIIAFLVVSMIGSSAVFAQEPSEVSRFAEDAQWYYEIADDGMGSGEGCIHMSVAGDTLLEGRKCQRLKIEACDGAYETLYEYVYPCGEKLYYYNLTAKDFFLLLDFSAQVGDTVWVHTDAFTPNPGFDPYQRWKLYDTDFFPFMAYTITAVDTVNMGGKTLKRQSAQPIINSEWMFPGWHQEYIIEGIGSLGGFFGEVWGLYPEWGKCRLRCFFADGKTFLKDGNCGMVTNKADEETFGLHLYPNPAKETVTLTATGCKLQRVEILDMNGRVLHAVTLNGTETFDYNVSQMSSGFYLARVKTSCGVLTEKFSVK